MKKQKTYLDNRTPEERKADSKIKAETTTSEETLREQIMNIISVPPDHEGGTGYLKLTDEEIDKIVKLFKQREKEILEELSKKSEKLKERERNWPGKEWAGFEGCLRAVKDLIEQKLKEIKK